MFAEAIHCPTVLTEWEINTQPQQPGYTQWPDPKTPWQSDKPMQPGGGNRTLSNSGKNAGGS
jgi:hypothetical protein